MFEDGVDAEEYIAAVRAGAIDPYGRTADELQESLDAYDRDWTERLMALTEEQLDEVVAGRMPLPALPGPIESEHAARFRAESEFVGRARALEVQTARLEAAKRELYAARFARLADEPGVFDTNLHETASNLAVELRLSDRTMERRMIAASRMVSELPLAHDAHRAGRINSGHLRTIEQATEALRLDATVDAGERARVEQELVAMAETTTPGQLRSRAKRIVDRVLTEPFQQRHDRARETREVFLQDEGDGMAFLGVRCLAVAAKAAYNRATDAARRKPKDDPRTFDQYRADVVMDLLTRGQVPDDVNGVHGVNGITATVALTIPATALLREPASDGSGRQELFPALLDDEILVDVDTVRMLAAETVTWERLFLHPVTGVPVTVDTYRPNRAMRRWLRARDGRCRWPGCNNPVYRADVDHTHDWDAGGATTIGNLAHLCRRHHTMKHATAWTVQQLEDGVLEFTSPLGVVLRSEPEHQGPAFVDTDDIIWGTIACTQPSLPNAPPPLNTPF
ncbi:HNH endonuclease signature motif containing protein [Agrococcus sp. KRD186]|uniref:HNH endonuclease signature motif containing protein n=1 Tax=Agrococcus sp. KRD186 TaxID=2729730 RepID=UPI0019D0F06B|nr:HNH endonuclease signature motif containing protein [Agrococcus sp. KRD186]